MKTPMRLLLRAFRLRLDTGCDTRCFFCKSWQAKPVRVDADAFFEGVMQATRRGAKTVAISGSEPLMSPLLPMALKALRSSGVDGYVTTNGRLLRESVPLLAGHGVTAVHVSLEQLTGSTRIGSKIAVEPATVIAGIDTALAAGLRVELNSLILRGHNFSKRHLDDLLKFSRDRGADLCLLDLLYGWNPDLRKYHVAYAEMRDSLAEWYGSPEHLVERSGTIQTRLDCEGVSVFLRDYRAIPNANICGECGKPGSLGLTPPQMSTAGTLSVCWHNRSTLGGTAESLAESFDNVYGLLDRDEALSWTRT